MTHPGSGNPTWRDFPNTSTPVTADSLEAIEGAVDTLAGKASPPCCEVRLTADYASLPGNSYLAMRGQMAAPAGMDPYGMLTKAAGVDIPYQLVVPSGWAGRYELAWHVFASGTAYNPFVAVGLLNMPDNIPNTGIAPYIAMRGVGNGMGDCRASAVLGVGDKIALGVYVVQAAAWNMTTVLTGAMVRTKAVFRYIGPT